MTDTCVLPGSMRQAMKAGGALELLASPARVCEARPCRIRCHRLEVIMTWQRAKGSELVVTLEHDARFAVAATPLCPGQQVAPGMVTGAASSPRSKCARSIAHF